MTTPIKKYVSKFTIHLGNATATGCLLPIRATVSKPKFKMVSPDGNPVSQRYLDVVNGNLYEPSECHRGIEDDDGAVKLVDNDVLAETKKSALAKDVMNVTVHPLEDVETQLFPSDNNAYIFQPDAADPVNKGWADFITAAVGSSKLAFLGTINLRGHEGLFRLSVWRGHLVVQKQLYPADLNPHEQAERTLTQALTKKAVTVAEAMVQPFDPDSYRSDVEARVDALAAEVLAGNGPVAAKPAKTTTVEFDLSSALDDMLKDI